MTLPLGTISMSEVNVELGLPANQNISLNQANVRALAQVPSGTISMANLQGKSNNLFRSGTITAGSSSFQTISIFGKNLGNGEGSCTPPDTFILNGGVVSFGINTTLVNGSFNQNFFQVSGTQPNSGWEKLVINSPVSGTITYFRVNAISFQTGGGISTWTWPTGGIIFSARNQQGSIVID